MLPRPLLLLSLFALKACAQQAGSFQTVGSTLISAMMMFIGNDHKVYILDKAEGNPTQINGHPAWGAVWDIDEMNATALEVSSNTFCASGHHLPNGSTAAFGGNNGVSPGPVDYHGPGVDPTYQDADGRTAIRVLNPCTGNPLNWPDSCQWFDNAALLAMQRRRWYSTAEALGDGSIALIGGMVNGGYINRPGPNPTDPVTQNGQAENTYEIYPLPENFTVQVVNFLVETGGLNTYTHAFLMPSGKMFLQANVSTTLWDPQTNEEDPLPNMPNDVVRVYPASGSAAMLPLTPANNYTPTIWFCGGMSAMNDTDWGGYGGPGCNPWEFVASDDCQRITPEPSDGSPAAYVQDDQLPVGRSMGQAIILPNGKLLIINGASNGTAGYTTQTPEIQNADQLPFNFSCASGPVLMPVIYDPEAPAGQRFSSKGLQPSTIPRMYHSSALLLPDGAVIVAGSNPNPDYSATVFFPTEARAEYWYPPYFNEPRPEPVGLPQNLTYGGSYFNITLGNTSYTFSGGDANAAAGNTTVVLIRPGFTTHGMNMGQRYVQLNNTFTVDDSGDITLHVSPPPPNPNLLTPGDVMIFVVMAGVPSYGEFLQVGSGEVETQPTYDIELLPNITLADFSSQNNSTTSGGGKSSGFAVGEVIGAVAGGIAAAGLIAVIIVWLCKRRQPGTKGMPFDSVSAPLRDSLYRQGGGHGGYQQQYSDSSYNPYGHGVQRNYSEYSEYRAPEGMASLGASMPTDSSTGFRPMNDYDSTRAPSGTQTPYYDSLRGQNPYNYEQMALAQPPRASFYSTGANNSSSVQGSPAIHSRDLPTDLSYDQAYRDQARGNRI